MSEETKLPITQLMTNKDDEYFVNLWVKEDIDFLNQAEFPFVNIRVDEKEVVIKVNDVSIVPENYLHRVYYHEYLNNEAIVENEGNTLTVRIPQHSFEELAPDFPMFDFNTATKNMTGYGYVGSLHHDLIHLGRSQQKLVNSDFYSSPELQTEFAKKDFDDVCDVDVFKLFREWGQYCHNRAETQVAMRAEMERRVKEMEASRTTEPTPEEMEFFRNFIE